MHAIEAWTIWCEYLPSSFFFFSIIVHSSLAKLLSRPHVIVVIYNITYSVFLIGYTLLTFLCTFAVMQIKTFVLYKIRFPPQQLARTVSKPSRISFAKTTQKQLQKTKLAKFAIFFSLETFLHTNVIRYFPISHLSRPKRKNPYLATPFEIVIPRPWRFRKLRRLRTV